MSDILLSIIIPAYNAAAFLRGTIDFIIKDIGDAKQVELLIVNDGSTDNTKQVIEQIKLENSNIIINHYSK